MNFSKLKEMKVREAGRGSDKGKDQNMKEAHPIEDLSFTETSETLAEPGNCMVQSKDRRPNRAVFKAWLLH